MKIKINLSNEKLMPNRANEGDAGMDLKANIDSPIVFNKGDRITIPTGLKIAIPYGYVGLVCPRSGLAKKHGLTITNAPGVVDAGYRGEVCAIMQMHGDEPVQINPYDRIAQLVIVPVAIPELDVVSELDDTARGEGGFGSTGRN